MSQMVPVATAANPFEARVIAARLGADGIVWQFQGSVDGPFALGAVTVLVAEPDYQAARELLLADEAELARSEPDDRPAPALNGWWLVAAIVAAAVFAVARLASGF
jgi:hypothetical protein